MISAAQLQGGRRGGLGASASQLARLSNCISEASQQVLMYSFTGAAAGGSQSGAGRSSGQADLGRRKLPLSGRGGGVAW